MKLYLIYLTVWSSCQAAYISRMATMNRIRSPAVFRPGVSLQRPWGQRLVASSSNRSPYVVYRNQPNHRYAMKHFGPAPTRMFPSPWKSTRLPNINEFEFMRAASAQPNGGIHTIPAPNLSLSEKPIVVIDADAMNGRGGISEATTKPTYEVTEKHVEQPARIQAPIGFSKETALVKHNAALQLASELGLKAVVIPKQSQSAQNAQNQQALQTVLHHQAIFPEQSLFPQQFTLQGLNGLQNQQTNQALTGFQGQPSMQAFTGQHHQPLLQTFTSPQNLNNFQGFQKVQQQDQNQQSFQGFHKFQQPDQNQQFFQGFQKFQQQDQNQQSFPGFQGFPTLQRQESTLQAFPGIQNQQSPTQGFAPIQNPQAFVSPIGVQTPQGFTGTQNSQDLIQSGSEGLVISPSALYQPDPNFLQKLQQQLLQRFPSVEFIPYVPEMQNQQQPAQFETQQESQPQYYVSNDQIVKQEPSSFVPSDFQKNVVQRETQESSQSEVTIVPQYVINNVTENQVEVSSPPQPQNVTIHYASSEPQPSTTTVKYIVETTTEEQKTTPIYYAQVRQNVGNVVASGFYSAVNDVRAASAAAQLAKSQEPTNVQIVNVSTTTINPDLPNYFAIPNNTNYDNNSVTEMKPLLGVPFAKKADSFDVAYTLVRTDEQPPKVTQNGVYVGQIVEAKVTEDQDFNKQQAILSRRPPLRVMSVQQNAQLVNQNQQTQASMPSQRSEVVKAKIPPKSKLTFDDKTGEPVLRIYASYVDSPVQKEVVASKLTNIKTMKDLLATRQNNGNAWNSGTVKLLDKPKGFEANPVTTFGLKLRSRSDDYVPLFDEYEE